MEFQSSPLDVASLEGLATSLYTRLRLDPAKPVSTFVLAQKLTGHEVFRPANMIGALAQTWTQAGQRRIAVKRRLPVEYARFFAGHEVGHLLLDEAGYRGEDTEVCADYLGAALMAPRPALVALHRAFGFDLSAISIEVGATETWAALRVGEVLRIPVAVVAPIIRVRGPENWVWGTDTDVRRLARLPQSKLPRGLVKTKLTDDPRRVVLMGDELTGTD